MIQRLMADSEASAFYIDKALMLNGIGTLCVMFPMLYLYKKDFLRRAYYGVVSRQNGWRITLREVILLLFLGIALAEIVNIAVGIIASFAGMDVYDDTMRMISEGKSIWTLILWVGLISPVVEEMLFRWVVFLRLRDAFSLGVSAVISGLLFGIYHGNMLQFLYASILGIYFALVLEWTGSLWTTILLHVGANIWSLLVSEYAEVIIDKISETQIILLFMAFIMIILYMTWDMMIHGQRKNRIL